MPSRFRRVRRQAIWSVWRDFSERILSGWDHNCAASQKSIRVFRELEITYKIFTKTSRKMVLLESTVFKQNGKHPGETTWQEITAATQGALLKSIKSILNWKATKTETEIFVAFDILPKKVLKFLHAIKRLTLTDTNISDFNNLSDSWDLKENSLCGNF